MPTLDEIVDGIADGKLRTQLQIGLTGLRRRKKLGLVFEEHIPESVLLPSAGIHVGAVVVRRNKPDDTRRLNVLAVSDDGLVVAAKDGAQDSLTFNDVLVVKPFGEPVYPVLSPVGSVGHAEGKPSHTVLNGENFHALQLLRFQHKGEVDCIYIDPPYNSGSKDWKYNNRYVDETDHWRHSKWLSFMEKRLRLAKELLNPDRGVLIVTIDENEVNHLGVLLEQVFPKHLRYMVTSVTNPKGTYKQNFGRVDEQLFFVVPNVGHDVIAPRPLGANDSDEDDTSDRLVRHLVALGNLDTEALLSADGGLAADEQDRLQQMVEEVDDDVDDVTAETETEEFDALPADPHFEYWFLRRRGQESSYRTQRHRSFYAILVNTAKDEVVGVGPPLGKEEPYEVTRDGDVLTVYPIDNEGHERVWRYSRPTMQKYIDAGEIVLGRMSVETGLKTLNHRKLKKDVRRHKTVWWYKSHDAGTHGSNVVTAFLGRRNAFPFPKSLYAVKDTLATVVRNRPNALILDFFAGSGTTLHATCLLNAEDDGKRRCILVTNNEVSEAETTDLHKAGLFRGDSEFEAAGIFEAVTKPRVEAAISGKRPDGQDVPGKYVGGQRYALGFDENVTSFRLDYADPVDVGLGDAFEAILPVLWMEARGIGNLNEIKTGEGMVLAEGIPFAVLLDEDRIKAFVDGLARRNDITHVWLVTDSERGFARMRSLIPAMPGLGKPKVSMLYRDFLRNFQVNIEVGR